jgi:hypothetical protein
MRRFEGNRCLQAALSAGCARLGTRSLRSTGAFHCICLCAFLSFDYVELDLIAFL